jgi:tetratricopeptide (TPR) repeat protein
MLKRIVFFAVIFFAVSALLNTLQAQPTWTIDPFGKEKKPEQFETRKLGSEKTAEKKFTTPRHFLQNTITHYNYYFNANNKINTVVDRAKMGSKEDYSQLLPFYPYTLDNTATQKTDLDSVIYTSTAGILLHDLRNDWIDNMYLLIGKAYYYKKDFDSAAMTFQFINYNLFPRKKHEDDDRVIGTNDDAANSVISIANKEKRNFVQRVVSLPPSRNDALIWLARTFIEQDDLGEAAGLINTLQQDPNLPKRLQNDLAEVTSYWYFRQAGYDSAAVHLEKALSNADDKQDRSRREFLLAQLYEMGGQYDKASHYYERASKHTVDPVLDIYAQLNEAKMFKNTGDIKELNRSIENLLKMARRDKFDTYRDIIYYSAGQLTLQRPDTTNALLYFNKSLKYNNGNASFKNKTFLQLGDIAYSRKKYRMAAAYYDSLQLGSDSSLNERIRQVQSRKTTLSKIVEQITNIEREDSLQHIAGMVPVDRENFVKRLARQMRKEQGLKEENNSDNNGMLSFNNNNNTSADLFGNNTSKGEWYFYNSTLKSRGFSEFKSKWGNRANTDNWRRKATLGAANNNAPLIGKDDPRNNPNNNPLNNNSPVVADDISYETLMGNLPLTPEKIAASNDILATSLLTLAKLYQSELEDYEQAIITYEDYLQRFPTRLADGEVYLGLYYCYTKTGNPSKAAYYKNLLNTQFANSKSAQLLNNPGALNPKTKNTEATKVYENIYNLFIEGNFEQAVNDKKKADAQYGVIYWTPQLLYIEALYNVKQRNDSLAIMGLNNIIQNNPSSPLKQKAATMIDVLKRRAEIEKYLTDLQVTREEEPQIIIDTITGNMVVVPAPPKPVVQQPAVVKPPVVKPPVDTVKAVAPPLTNGEFKMSLSSPHYVLMILDKVDGVYVNEAKNAFTRYNKEQYYGETITITKDAIDADRNLLVIASFADADAALKYYDKIRKAAGSEVSWLPANKYSFLIITDDNLQLLKANKKLADYKTLLNTQYSNRF